MQKREIPAPVQEVLDMIQSHGYEAVLVGGCVRDMLLSRPVHDYDVATNALPAQVTRLFARTRETGIKHGTVTVISDQNCPVEVTTYRSETSYSDGRHPDEVTFGATLIEDLSRRDFTINAMALTNSGEVVDPFDGRADLVKKRIRAVGLPLERFQEDSLRILRAVRFAAQLSFDIEQGTLHAMKNASSGLTRVSRERIGQEFLKIALADWWHILPVLAEGGFLFSLPSPLPGMQSAFERLANCPRECQKNWDNLFHFVDAETRRLGTWGTWLMFAANPRRTAKELFSRLAIPSRDANTVGHIAEVAKEELVHWTKNRWREVLFRIGNRPVQIAARIRDGLALNTLVSYQSLCDHYSSQQPIWSRKDLAIPAGELQKFGLNGPRIGQAIELLCNAVLKEEYPNTKTDLVQFLQKSLAEGRV